MTRRVILFSLLTALFLFSCQKEFSLENGGIQIAASGTLKSGTTNDCLQSVVHGIYKAGSVLGVDNFIDVQVDVTEPGFYVIQSNLVNGFSFRDTGTFTATGINTIHLLASGKPVAAKTSTFTIRFITSSCTIDVTVI